MGSDHFPILVDLALNEAKKEENRKEQLHADPEEQAVADEKIEKAS
jgi:hypothetical protein